jgi:hypothetical protein
MRLGHKPLVVLTQGKPNPDAEMEKIWMRFQNELATRSTHSRHLVAGQSGHDIHNDQPELAIVAIRSVVETLTQP